MTALAIPPNRTADNSIAVGARATGTLRTAAELTLAALIAASFTLATVIALDLITPASTSCTAALSADPDIALHRITQ